MAINTDSIIVLGIEDQLPVRIIEVGEIKIKDGGFKTNCGYEQTIFEAKIKAQKLGANIIKLTEIKAPDAWSTCYRIKAVVYKAQNISAIYTAQKKWKTP